MRDYYAIEKFQEAVRVLATAPQGIGERLHGALGYLSNVKSSNLPEELHERFRKVNDAETTSRRMSEREAAEIAKTVYEIFLELVKPWEHGIDPAR